MLYWLLISKDKREINANIKWERDLPPEIREFYFNSYTELSSQKENCSRMVLQKMRFVLTADKMTQ